MIPVSELLLNEQTSESVEDYLQTKRNVLAGADYICCQG